MATQHDIMSGEINFREDMRPSAPGWRFHRISCRPMDLPPERQPVYCHGTGRVRVYVGMGVYIRVEDGPAVNWWEAIPTPETREES